MGICVGASIGYYLCCSATSTATSTIRRRRRRQRATVRRQFWLHQKGFIKLRPVTINKYIQVLASHHSADQLYIQRLQRRLCQTPATMAEWRCRRCWKVASGRHVHCPHCGGRWDRVQDLTFTPQERQSKSPRASRTVHASGWDWQDEGGAASARGRSASAKSRTQPRRKQKKKNSASETVPYYATPAMHTPWKPEEEMVKEHDDASTMAAASAEMVREFREAYPNPATMPPDVRRIVEKYDAQTGTGSRNHGPLDLSRSMLNENNISTPPWLL